MASLSFIGTVALTLDGKGRLSVPARHRDALRTLAENALVVTKHPDGCLLVFPRPSWQPFHDKVVALPMEAQRWKRMFVGGASEVDIDGASRALIDPGLRAYAGLERDVKLVGMGPYFELWDAQRFEADEAKLDSNDMPDSIKGLL